MTVQSEMAHQPNGLIGMYIKYFTNVKFIFYAIGCYYFATKLQSAKDIALENPLGRVQFFL